MNKLTAREPYVHLSLRVPLSQAHRIIRLWASITKPTKKLPPTRRR